MLISTLILSMISTKSKYGVLCSAFLGGEFGDDQFPSARPSTWTPMSTATERNWIATAVCDATPRLQVQKQYMFKGHLAVCNTLLMAIWRFALSLSIYLSIYLSISISIVPSIYASTYRFKHQSNNLPIYVSIPVTYLLCYLSSYRHTDVKLCKFRSKYK